MALVRWEPTRELDTLQGDVNRLFDSFFGRRDATASAGRWVPAMDLIETDEDLVLRADLPGMDRSQIEIEMKENILTVSGERRSEHESEHEGYHRVERSFGRFSRSLGLPRGVDPESVKASFERGVLEVRVPKPAERKAMRIDVAGSEDSEGRSEQPELVGAGA